MNSSPFVDGDARRTPPPGITLPLDVLVAPDRAIARIAETRDWVATAIVLIVLGVTTALLEWPATAHLEIRNYAKLAGTEPQLTPDQISTDVLHTLIFAQTSQQFLFFVLIAAIFTLGARLKGAATPFSTLFALAVNAALPSAIGGALAALAIRLHDPASFHSMAQLALALPINLAVFAPHGSDPEVAFLGDFDVFELWTLVLMGYGYAVLTKTRLASALALSLGIGIAFALGQFVV